MTKKGLLKLVKRSLVYYKSAVFYQFLITALLAAVIAGCLLTGSSVRHTLRENTEKKLNNAGFVISSGLRYFDPGLSLKTREKLDLQTASILELKGFTRNFKTNATAINVQIFGIDNNFFSFNPDSQRKDLSPGEALINRKLAEKLDIEVGDDLIIRFESISEIPLHAPFAPEEDPTESIILRISAIAEDDPYDHFNLGISQLKPLNVFINLSEFKNAFHGDVKANRLLIAKDRDVTRERIEKTLKEALSLEDVGYRLRANDTFNQHEIISDRIFIDDGIADLISDAIPNAFRLISYLVNRFQVDDRETPYSFVSAIPDRLFPVNLPDNGIVINKWLADDLNANPGDTINLDYFVSNPNNTISKRSTEFKVDRTVNIEGIWSDSTLMPEFPGISGKESCSSWDAGVLIDFKKIRDKDEEYWYEHGGTPKAFIKYSDGEEIWGNNFGSTTALRMPDTSEAMIRAALYNRLEPSEFGFSIIDAYSEGIKAADNGVDFSSLFLGLSFFIIVSCLLLLSLLVSSFFETRKTQVKTLYSIGFTNRRIAAVLLLETALISFVGSLTGIFLGVAFNKLIISTLNSVWKGAVQTNTLAVYVHPGMMSAAFVGSFVVAVLVLLFRTKWFLKYLSGETAETGVNAKAGYINWLFPGSLFLVALSFLAITILPHQKTALFFVTGSLLFISLLLLFRWLLNFKLSDQHPSKVSIFKYSRRYYAFYPARALTPIIFIAAGLFIIMVTGANRKSFDTEYLSKSSGTGGYLLWGETMTPVGHDLNADTGRKKLGFDAESVVDLSFLQALKLSGDDASCLNLNQVSSPSILGIDGEVLKDEKRFSFAETIDRLEVDTPWEALSLPPKDNVIYGIADQTVLQWGLKLSVGDRLSIVAENGNTLHIVIAGGLKPSVFQGFLLIGRDNFSRFMPSIPGNSVFLAAGDPRKRERYKKDLSELLGSYGLSIEFTEDRLAAFYEVTNTYLTVFMTLGGLGMVIGMFGLGLILTRNLKLREKELALLIANGFSTKNLKRLIYREYMLILFCGVLTGTVPALLATLPSLLTIEAVTWNLIFSIICAVLLLGISIIMVSTNRLFNKDLTSILSRE